MEEYNNENLRPYLVKLGKRIKELRYQKGYKNYENFAVWNDIARSQMWRYEQGRNNISFLNLMRIIKGLGVTVEEFFSEGFDEDENTGK